MERAHRVDDALLDRATEHRAMRQRPAEVTVPQVAVGVEVDQPEWPVHAGQRA